LTAQLLTFVSVMKNIGGVVLAIVILLVMVTIHEFGHYIAGKILNFKINEFSVGFGPAIFKKRSKKTGELFAVRIVPLGGYCAFDGEDYEEGEEGKAEETTENAEPFAEIALPAESSEAVLVKPLIENEGTKVETNVKIEGKIEEKIEEKEEECPEPKGVKFNDQAPWKRIIVLVAGATMNYLLALFLIIIMFVGIGQPQYKIVENVGFTPSEEYAEAYEKEVEDSVFELGDVIVKVAGKKVFLPVDYMDALRGKKAGEEVSLSILRTGEDGKQTLVEETLILDADCDFANMSDTGTLVTALGLPHLYAMQQSPVRFGFFNSLGNAFKYSGKLGGMVLRSFGELLTGKMSITGMGGPVTTITVTSQAALSGLFSFLNVAGLIGVNLAVFNLLPIPALDGSKVVFCIVEWIRGKPINRKVETMIHFIGIIFLFGFAILVDVLHLFL
jgi:regulator of sigma E protease